MFFSMLVCLSQIKLIHGRKTPVQKQNKLSANINQEYRDLVVYFL